MEEAIAAEPEARSLAEDVESVLYFLVYLFRGFLMVSYVIGKFIVEWSHWIGLTIWDGLCVASDAIKLVAEAVIEFEESLIRGVALARYGVDKIFDSFEIIIYDLVNFLHGFQDNLRGLLLSAFGGFGTALDVLIITVPQHICGALAIIGDFTLELLQNICIIIQDFLLQLIWSPVNVLLQIYAVALCVAALPGKILAAIPLSAHVGSLVILAFYVLYCKLSFFRLIGVLATCLTAIYGTVKRIPHFLVQIGRLLDLSRIKDAVNSDIEGRADMKGMCVICHENLVTYLANPCNHVCLCERCVRMMMEHDDRCPMCRKRVNHYSKVYVS